MGGCETNPDLDNRGICLCAHLGKWVALQDGTSRGDSCIQSTADSRREIGKWYLKKMDRFLKTMVEEYKKASPESYNYWVNVWEQKRLDDIVIEGFTTDEKCSHYPFPLVVPTDRATETHIDTNDVASVKNVTCQVGLLGKGYCCRGGLLLPGARTWLIQNTGDLTFTSAQNDAHQYVLQDKSNDSNINVCSGYNEKYPHLSVPCSTIGKLYFASN